MISTSDPGRTIRAGLAGIATGSECARNTGRWGSARAACRGAIGLAAWGASTLPRAAWKKALCAATRASLTGRGWAVPGVEPMMGGMAKAEFPGEANAHQP